MAEIKPNRAIRRFDVFAEYQRLKGLKEKMAPDVAKGYGIWLAKVVAARKFSKSTGKGDGEKAPGDRGDKTQDLVDNKWHTLDDTPQTDKLFEEEIVRRMGSDFYENVFSPAVKHAFDSGKDYKDIRDAIRKDWKP